MKSMAAVGLIVAVTALPLRAQRGMAHGGFSGHGGFVGHGGVSAPIGSRFAGPGHSFGFTPPSTFNRSLPVTPASRPASFNHYPRRTPFMPVYRRRGIFIGAVSSGIYPYYAYSGYPGLFGGGDDSQQYPIDEQAPPPDYGEQAAPYSEQAPPGDYGPAPNPYYAPVPPSAQNQSSPPLLPPYTYYSVPPAATYYVVPPPPPPPAEETPVMVIFRNGRAPERIHNYLLTRTTLTVLDQPYWQVPLDEIDIAATVEKNRAAGVDFRVPGDSR